MTNDETNDQLAPVEKRIYVGGLPALVTPDQVKDRFATFGSVSNVTIAKTEQGDCRGFGHFSIKTTPKQWTTCLSIYNGAKWKGVKMRLEESKPDYLERKRAAEEQETLKAEKKRKRERRWNNSDGFFAKDMSLVTDNNVNTRSGKWKRGRYGRAVAVMRLRKDDGTRFVYDPLNYKNNLEKIYDIGVRMKPARNLPMFYDANEQEDQDDILRRQQQQLKQQQLKQQHNLQKPLDSIDVEPSRNDGAMSMVEGKDQGEVRRLAAIERKSEELKAKKELMKQAENERRHISFDQDSHSIQDVDKEGKVEEGSTHLEPKDGAKWMFDSDSDDDHNLDIQINPVLEGEKGRERLELQSRYQGDNRFKLDEAFMDDDEQEDNANSTSTRLPNQNDDIAKSLGEEKNQSLDVLRAMFGDIKVMTQTKPDTQWSSTARYDPDAEDSSNYLLEPKKSATNETESDNEDDNEDLPLIRRPDNPLPIVSTDKHFSVNVNLKPLFGAEEEPFKLFGDSIDEEEDEASHLDNVATVNNISTSFIPKTTESHVGLGLMFFLHLDDPKLVKKSCYNYDPKGIFQRNQEESEKYETEWKTNRQIVFDVLKKRGKSALQKQRKLAKREAI